MTGERANAAKRASLQIEEHDFSICHRGNHEHRFIAQGCSVTSFESHAVGTDAPAQDLEPGVTLPREHVSDGVD